MLDNQAVKFKGSSESIVRGRRVNGLTLTLIFIVACTFTAVVLLTLRLHALDDRLTRLESKYCLEGQLDKNGEENYRIRQTLDTQVFLYFVFNL